MGLFDLVISYLIKEQESTKNPPHVSANQKREIKSAKTFSKSWEQEEETSVLELEAILELGD